MTTATLSLDRVATTPLLGEQTKHAAPQAQDRATRTWLVSPAWDFFWLLPALWLIPIMYFVTHVWPGGDRLGPMYSVAGLVGYAHFISPMVMAWSSRDFRAAMTRQPARFIYMPLLLFTAAIAVGALGSWVTASWPGWLHPRTTILFYVLFLVNMNHFSGQHFGVLSIYRQLSGQTEPRDRKVDRAFTVAMLYVLVPCAWFFQSVDVGKLLLPLVPGLDGQVVGHWVVGIVSASMLVFVLGFELRKARRSLPRMLYLTSVGVQPILAIWSYGTFNFAMYFLAHWIIALAIASLVLERRGQAEPARSGRIRRFTGSFFGKMAAVAIAALPLWVLFTWFPLHQYGMSYDQSVTAPVVPGPLGVLVGAAVGLGLCHLLYDRFVYAFRNADVRAATGRFLFRAP
jgi:hypothetical protein